MALDLTNLATRQVNTRSSISSGVGWRRVTVRMTSVSRRSASCTRSPPLTRLKSIRWTASEAQSPHSRRRTFFLAATAREAADETRGATITSTNWRSTMVRAVASSSSPLKAMMPPKADSGSVP